MPHRNPQLLRSMSLFGVGVCSVSGLANLAQSYATGGPLLWSVGAWGSILVGQLFVLSLLQNGRALLAARLYVLTVALGTIPVVLLETPLGGILVSTLGPLYAGLAAVAILPTTLQRRWRWGIALESMFVLYLRHALRPIPSVEWFDLLPAGAAIAITVFSLVGLVATVVGHLSEVNDAKQQGIERLHKTNQALAIAHDRALAASNAKAAFLAHMSHELRTPLNAVLGYTELLVEEEALDATSRGDLEKIQTAADHLLGMISDVLDLSRVEAGQQDLEIQNLDTTELCNEVATIVLPRVQARGNRWVLEVERATAQSDPRRIRQILINLLENASRFTTGGTITLRSAPLQRGDRRGVRFEVEDTGTGIEAAFLSEIFEPFATTDGTGIGLTLSRALAESLGGDLEAASTPGEGSTFRLWIPDLGQSLPPID